MELNLESFRAALLQPEGGPKCFCGKNSALHADAVVIARRLRRIRGLGLDGNRKLTALAQDGKRHGFFAAFRRQLFAQFSDGMDAIAVE